MRRAFDPVGDACRVGELLAILTGAGQLAVIGFVLGPMMEENFRRAMMLSHRDTFVTQPISAGLLALALALLVMLILPAVRARREDVYRE